MGASRYVGRIGGLAVALGVGAAAFVGCGVAVAAPAASTSSAGSAGTGATTPSATDDGLAKGHHKTKGSAPAGSDPQTTTGSPDTVASTHKSKKSRPSSSSAQFQPDAQVASAMTNAGSGGAAATDVFSPKASATASSTSTSAVVRAAVVAEVTAPVNTPVAANVAATTATRSTSGATTSILTVLVGLVDDVLKPTGGNVPATPSGSPTAWVQLAAARREIGGATVNLVSTGPITVSPTLTFNDGIIEGSANAVDSKGLSLAYTIVSAPSAGGKITFIPEESPGTFGYLPDASVLTSGNEKFSELVSEVTPFDSLFNSVVGNVPIVGTVAQGFFTDLYRVPIVSTALAPIIGSAVVVPFTADPSTLNPMGAPIAFTVKVTSFDGTKISTNFFPAAGLTTGQSAPTILEGPGLGSNGLTDPESTTGIGSSPGLVPGIATLRDAGYNVTTWDPRGEGASGGTLQLDSPAFEGKDVSSIITDVLSLPETANNQRIGMVGGSYGGGIQLVSAAIDPRIDAIVPGIAWNTLNASLYPNNAFKTSWAALLTLDLLEAGARINPQIYSGVITGTLLGILTGSQQALLANSGPGALVSDITVPTLLLQGTVDDLFPLSQAVTNAQLLAANNVPVKMVWFCGGHGICLDPGDPAGQATLLTKDTLAWLDQYVKQDGTPADSIPTFQWVDQSGNFYSSKLFPSNPAFQGTPVTASGSGGTLPIVPIIGGAGPQTEVFKAPLSLLEAGLLSLATAAPARNAVNLDVSVTPGTQIVGAPQLTFTYSGLGTTRTVYAQIVDKQSGLVLGNIDTPIPVTLNGRAHTVSIALGTLNDIAYTAPAGGGTLELQLVGSATQYENLTSYGVMHVSGMTLSLPTVGSGAGVVEE